MNNPLTIVELRIANVKRLRAVRIRPDPGNPIVKLTGPNDAGKSSVLDSILYALAGERNIAAEPIRRGADKAEIRLDLGEIVVTRKFTKSGSSLSVTAADGAAFTKPQAVLDKLYGGFTFDPLAFLRLKPREQRDKLLAMTGLAAKVADLDGKKLGLEQQRTQEGRELRQLDGAVASIEAERLPEAKPETVDTAAILTDRKGREHNAKVIADAQANERQCVFNINHCVQQASELRRQIADLQKRLEISEATAAKWTAAAEQIRLQLSGVALPTFDDLDAKLVAADQTNAAARRWQERETLRGQQLSKAQAVEKLAQSIRAIEEAKGQLIGTVKMPVDGLGFNENGVTFKGLPLEQICSGDQWRISTAIGIAENPRLRIMRILDGSLLDGARWKAIEDAAREGGFQIWIEQVAQWKTPEEKAKAIAEPSGVIFEDGEIIASETGADGEVVGESAKV